VRLGRGTALETQTRVAADAAIIAASISHLCSGLLIVLCVTRGRPGETRGADMTAPGLQAAEA
jgi:hypothetical protein